jgi:hypothetical protein
MTAVVVAGPVANKPSNGGNASVMLTLVRGLLELGVDAYLVEELDEPAEEAIGFFHHAVRQLGLQGRAALLPGAAAEADGIPLGRLRDLASSADLLVNVSGHLRRPELLGRFRRRAYLDLDPGFTQYWQAQGISGARLKGHDIFFTVGLNIGSSSCPIPTCGIDWRPVLPPVILGDWPVVERSRQGFTTISSWRGAYGPIEAEGRRYGLKVHEFRRFIELPQRTGQRFELALDIDPSETADLERLQRTGWRLLDPKAVAGDPGSYREFLLSARAEFSVAKGVYVHTASGWFSDRTARFLAAGKPALVQNTGLSRMLPTGMGLVPFSTPEEAVAGAGSITTSYEEHSQAARAFAEAHLDSRLVLSRMLEEAGVA